MPASELRPSRTHYYVSVVTSALAIALGSAQIAGGVERFSNPSYAGARALMPHYGWGAVMMLGGVLLGVGIMLSMRRLRMVGLATISAWSAFFASGIAYAATQSPTAVWGAVYVYAWIAAVSATLARTDVGQIKAPAGR